MKIELKRISFNARLSEETNAFAADIWIDGKKVGTAQNAGHGGPTNVYIADKATREAAEAYAKSLPPVHAHGMELKMDLEFHIDNLLSAHLERTETLKQYKRWCKKSVVFRVKGDAPDSWRTLKAVDSPQAREAVRKKYGDQVECILNEALEKGEIPGIEQTPA